MSVLGSSEESDQLNQSRGSSRAVTMVTMTNDQSNQSTQTDTTQSINQPNTIVTSRINEESKLKKNVNKTLKTPNILPNVQLGSGSNILSLSTLTSGITQHPIIQMGDKGMTGTHALSTVGLPQHNINSGTLKQIVHQKEKQSLVDSVDVASTFTTSLPIGSVLQPKEGQTQTHNHLPIQIPNVTFQYVCANPEQPERAILSQQERNQTPLQKLIATNSVSFNSATEIQQDTENVFQTCSANPNSSTRPMISINDTLQNTTEPVRDLVSSISLSNMQPHGMSLAKDKQSVITQAHPNISIPPNVQIHPIYSFYPVNPNLPLPHAVSESPVVCQVQRENTMSVEVIQPVIDDQGTHVFQHFIPIEELSNLSTYLPYLTHDKLSNTVQYINSSIGDNRLSGHQGNEYSSVHPLQITNNLGNTSKVPRPTNTNPFLITGTNYSQDQVERPSTLEKGIHRPKTLDGSNVKNSVKTNETSIPMNQSHTRVSELSSQVEGEFIEPHCQKQFGLDGHQNSFNKTDRVSAFHTPTKHSEKLDDHLTIRRSEDTITNYRGNGSIQSLNLNGEQPNHQISHLSNTNVITSTSAQRRNNDIFVPSSLRKMLIHINNDKLTRHEETQHNSK